MQQCARVKYIYIYMDTHGKMIMNEYDLILLGLSCLYMYIMVSDLLHHVHTDRWLESLSQGSRDTVDMAPDGPWNLNMPQLDIVMLTISIYESYVNTGWW